MDDPEVALMALRLAKGSGATDAISIVRTTDWRMMRFSNNGVTASKATRETSLTIFMEIGRGRTSLRTTDLSRGSIEGLVRNASNMAKASSEGYAPLPEGRREVGQGGGDLAVQLKPQGGVYLLARSESLTGGRHSLEY